MYIASTEIKSAPTEATGRFVTIAGEKFYEIANYDAMQPFFISLANDTDLWMYLSSTGGLTCGRKSPETALFPYYTDDKITENFVHTGPKTIIRAQRGEQVYLWEPFTPALDGLYRLERCILKSVTGNKLIFRESNHDLGLCFSYMWTSADKFGWIRKASIENIGNEAVEVEFIDGLQNVLPAGTNRVTQNTYSTLVDGYKKTEILPLAPSGERAQGKGALALFEMEAIMVDRAEPSEALRCNTIYCLGLPKAEYMASSRALAAFRKGDALVEELVSKGVRGAVFVHSRVALMVGASKSWYFVADVEKDACDVRAMMQMLTAENDVIARLEDAVKASTDTLRAIVAQNDGVQLSADEHVNARHFANVLFNTMRGGFYVDNYQISGPAFRKHVALFNKSLAERHKDFLSSLPDAINYADLEKEVKDAQLKRLFLEYLPLTFSRRHGDPSRPWNLFNIRVNDADGRRLISYQGNWRDIFQNWEALSVSYPGYINGIIAKFLNATTIDGYNPYKVTSEGIDWEVINPDDPWSNIGYWGDHQIIYLLKLLELSYQHDPKALEALLNDRLYAYANVPYRLKAYADIVADPKNSITFDDELHQRILAMIPTYGQDARLVMAKDGEPLLVTFTEKILLTLLTKLSNFIPEAGIWMNTLRPEWNDANNALVGNGASMVTLCYMRRYVRFLQHLLEDSGEETFQFTDELATFFKQLNDVLVAETPEMMKGFTDEARRRFTDAVGQAGETYRKAAYAGLKGKLVFLPKVELLAFLRLLKSYIDRSIRANKREDGLYNAYNIVTFDNDASLPLQGKGLRIGVLYPMLEGQVAALTSGTLAPNDVVALLDTMRESSLYRADQNSYMLYPARRRLSFLEKNNIPADAFSAEEAEALLKTDVIRRDCDGCLHFNPAFNNASFIPNASEKVLQVYEDVFRHREFTGRSGTFYKYEGLGCIYWHMVSKLLLAVGENIQREANNTKRATLNAEGTERKALNALIKHYYSIQAGIGAHKSPAQYGSFPFDPYSHTPSMAGVQQPGMTGQVKEDILNRWFELGLQVQNGELHISDIMLREDEFLDDKLCFTYCATPFEYLLGGSQKGINVEFADGGSIHVAGYTLDQKVCRHIFARDHAISKIIVNF